MSASCVSVSRIWAQVFSVVARFVVATVVGAAVAAAVVVVLFAAVVFARRFAGSPYCPDSQWAARSLVSGQCFVAS